MKKLKIAFFLGIATFTATAQTDSVYVLDLQECIDIAIENNLTLKRSKLQKEQAQIDLVQSQANRLPDFSVGGNYGYNWGRSIDPTTNDFITQQIAFAGFSGSTGVTLFNWFRITNSIKQNKLLWDASGFDVKKAKNDIQLNVVTYYLNVIFNLELLQNAEYQLSSSREQLERTKKLVDNGALARTNELELISQTATNEVNLVNAENSLKQALVTLKQAMLIPVSQEIDIVIPDLEATGLGKLEMSVDQVYSLSLEQMPEMKSAKLQVEGAAMGVKVAEAGYAPNLSLNGSLRSNYSDAFLQPTASGMEIVPFTDQIDQNLSRSLSLNLSIPIFNNLQAKSNVQRAKINLQQAEIAVKEQENALRQAIESAYNDAEAAAKTYQASTRQVEALEETFRSVENQYNLGAANLTDYQLASNNLFRAKSDLVRAKFDFIFKRKILDFYQGKNISF